MEYKFSFEKLEVWQIVWQIVAEVYKLTEKFPEKEKFGLVRQMRRAAVSVCANLAEGVTRSSPKEQGHFSSIVYGSLIELLNHLILSFDLEYISDDELQFFRKKIQPLSVKINNLRIRQLSRLTKQE